MMVIGFSSLAIDDTVGTSGMFVERSVAQNVHAPIAASSTADAENTAKRLRRGHRLEVRFCRALRTGVDRMSLAQPKIN